MAGILGAQTQTYNGQQVMPADDYKAQAAKLYQDNMGRAGDAGGVDYWAGQLASGKSASDVGDAFKSSTNGIYKQYAADPGAYDKANPGMSDYFKGDAGAISAMNSAQPKSGTGILSVPQTNAPLINPEATGYTPTAATTTNYGASQADAVKALAQGYTADKLAVSPESTSAYQLNQILGSDSPLMQQAATSGLQQANRRGILNSTMAIGAAQDAMIRNATPIAQQDANTYANAGTLNANSENAARQFGAQAGNTADLQNSQLGTSVNVSNAGASTQASRDNANAANTTSQFNSKESNTAAAAQADNNVKLQLQTIQSNTQMSMQDKLLASNQLISRGDNDTKTLLQTMDAAAKIGQLTLDADTKMKVANMDKETKIAMAKTESDYKSLVQTNTSAAAMFNQYVTNLANISASTTMDGAAKQAASDNQINAMNAGLSAIQQISALDLAKWFPTVDTDARDKAAKIATAKETAMQQGILNQPTSYESGG